MMLFAAAAAATAAMPGTTMTYAARGQAPGWTLTISLERGATDRAVFEFQGGNRSVIDLTRVVTLSPGGTRRWTNASRQMSVLVAPLVCRETSGERFPDTVTVRYAGQVLRGCGGAKAARSAIGARSIENVEWMIEDIGGKGIVDRSRATIAFRNGRVAGGSGCNSFSGLASIDGARLRLGPLMSTEMGCEPALMVQETRLHDLLRAATRWRIDDHGALVIESANGRILTARRAS